MRCKYFWFQTHYSDITSDFFAERIKKSEEEDSDINSLSWNGRIGTRIGKLCEVCWKNLIGVFLFVRAYSIFCKSFESNAIRIVTDYMRLEKMPRIVITCISFTCTSSCFSINEMTKIHPHFGSWHDPQTVIHHMRWQRTCLSASVQRDWSSHQNTY